MRGNLCQKSETWHSIKKDKIKPNIQYNLIGYLLGNDEIGTKSSDLLNIPPVFVISSIKPIIPPMARPEITEPNINPLPLKKGRIHFGKKKSQEKKYFFAVYNCLLEFRILKTRNF